MGTSPQRKADDDSHCSMVANVPSGTSAGLRPYNGSSLTATALQATDAHQVDAKCSCGLHSAVSVKSEAVADQVRAHARRKSVQCDVPGVAVVPIEV